MTCDHCNGILRFLQEKGELEEHVKMENDERVVVEGGVQGDQ